MKKVFAILLLAVHVFNLVGYTFFFRFLQQRNSQQTLQYIDTGTYSDEDLVLVKVPMSMPYSSNLADYERYDGEIEWGGVHYNYVKRKLSNDTLYVLCLPNEHRSKLVDAEKKYGQQVNDIPSKQKNNDASAKKGVLANEFDKQEQLYTLADLFALRDNHYSFFSTPLVFTYRDCNLQPPDYTIV